MDSRAVSLVLVELPIVNCSDIVALLLRLSTMEQKATMREPRRQLSKQQHSAKKALKMSTTNESDVCGTAPLQYPSEHAVTDHDQQRQRIRDRQANTPLSPVNYHVDANVIGIKRKHDDSSGEMGEVDEKQGLVMKLEYLAKGRGFTSKFSVLPIRKASFSYAECIENSRQWQARADQAKYLQRQLDAGREHVQNFANTMKVAKIRIELSLKSVMCSDTRSGSIRSKSAHG